MPSSSAPRLSGKPGSSAIASLVPALSPASHRRSRRRPAVSATMRLFPSRVRTRPLAKCKPSINLLPVMDVVAHRRDGEEEIAVGRGDDVAAKDEPLRAPRQRAVRRAAINASGRHVLDDVTSVLSAPVLRSSSSRPFGLSQLGAARPPSLRGDPRTGPRARRRADCWATIPVCFGPLT